MSKARMKAFNMADIVHEHACHLRVRFCMCINRIVYVRLARVNGVRRLLCLSAEAPYITPRFSSGGVMWCGLSPVFFGADNQLHCRDVAILVAHR